MEQHCAGSSTLHRVAGMRALFYPFLKGFLSFLLRVCLESSYSFLRWLVKENIMGEDKDIPL